MDNVSGSLEGIQRVGKQGASFQVALMLPKQKSESAFEEPLFYSTTGRKSLAQTKRDAWND